MDPPAEPSVEATQLAELADDTLRAFERKFRGRISWTTDMPGLVTAVDASLREEAVILELVVKAYEERVRFGSMAWMHEHVRADHLADEERHKKEVPSYQAGMERMMKLVEEQMSGKKSVHASDPKTQQELAANSDRFLRSLGLEDKGRTIYDPLPSPGAEAEPGLPSPEPESAEGSTAKPATRTGGDAGSSAEGSDAG